MPQPYCLTVFHKYPPTLRFELFVDTDVATFGAIYEYLSGLRDTYSRDHFVIYRIDIRIAQPSQALCSYLERRGYVALELADTTCFSNNVSLSKI